MELKHDDEEELPVVHFLQRYRDNVRDRRDDEILSWMDAEGRVTQAWTFGDLNCYVSNMAAYLVEHCGVREGDRVIVTAPPSLEFIVGFMACLEIGAIVVSVYPPDPSKLTGSIKKLNAVIEDSGAKVMVTSSTVKRALQLGSVIHSLDKVEIVAHDKFAQCVELPATVYQADVPLDAIAFIQYTSGSTGTPVRLRSNDWAAHRCRKESLYRIATLLTSLLSLPFPLRLIRLESTAR